jgi:alkylation response protein AidB-like acyl-CoA dehydrogenase
MATRPATEETTTVPAFPEGRAEKRAALMQAVEQVRDVVMERADEAEELGTLPLPTVEALEAAGLFRLKLPRELGGAEADPVTHLEVVEAVSYIDPSAGWTTMIGSTSIGLLGAYLPDEAIEQIFPGGKIPRAAAVTIPAGKAAPVDGGYNVSGRWPFASGSRHAHWLAGGGRVPSDGDAPPVYRMFAFPAEAAELQDNWHVSGLQGTGSCDFVLPERFIPAAFAWDFLAGPPHRGGPLYHIRAPGSMANEHAGFALGVARRALDTVVEIGATKRRGYAMKRSSLADRGVFQRMVGENDLRLRAARQLTIDAYERAFETVSAGEKVPPRLQAEMRAVCAFATAVAADVTTDAFRYAGASALYKTSLLQRHLRDINAASQHVTVSDIAYENHGKFILDLPDADPRG